MAAGMVKQSRRATEVRDVYWYAETTGRGEGFGGMGGGEERYGHRSA